LFEIIGDCGDEYRWSYADKFDHSKDTDVEVKIYCYSVYSMILYMDHE
jgi:hypothetical protein